MSIYLCNSCGQMKDHDYCLCSQDPYDEFELICEDCADELEDEEE